MGRTHWDRFLLENEEKAWQRGSHGLIFTVFLDDELQPALFVVGCETGGPGAQSLAHERGGNSDFPQLSLWKEN